MAFILAQRQAVRGFLRQPKSQIGSGLRKVSLRAVQKEDGPSTSGRDNTVFYGGKSYTEAEWAEAVKTGKATRIVAAPKTAVSSASPSLVDVMAFSGPGPEVINGRLAMLGFVSAVAAEFVSGEGVLKQWSEEPTGILAAFVIFMAASLAPLLQPNTQDQELGPFTAKAEMLNGRAAMIGFAALLVIEAVKGSPLF